VNERAHSIGVQRGRLRAPGHGYNPNVELRSGIANLLNRFSQWPHRAQPHQLQRGRASLRQEGSALSRGSYFSSAAKIGQLAQGRVLQEAADIWDFAFRGDLKARLDISKQVFRVHRPFNGLHSITSLASSHARASVNPILISLNPQNLAQVKCTGQYHGQLSV
jgi:hypothetical protein